MRSLDTSLRCPPLYQKQREFLRDVLGSQPLSSHAAVGGWGSGKSTLAAVCAALTAFRNGHTQDYGPTHPRFLILGPTQRIVEDVPCTILDKILPSEVIMRKWLRPWRVQLVNGTMILARSAESEIEGIDVSGLWLTEIQHPSYWADERFVPNIVARCRDPYASHKRIIYDGLPGANVRPYLDDAAINLTRFATTDNPCMTADVVETLKRSIPAHLEASLIRGEWGQTEGSAWPQFDPSASYVDGYELAKDRPIHIAVDAGNHSHLLVFTYERTRDAHGEYTRLVVLDELPMLHVSLAVLCQRMKEKWPHYKVGAGSTISHDPTLRYDETGALSAAFPGAKLVRWYKSDALYHHDVGNTLVRWALKDASGRIRILFRRHLERGGKGGIVDAMLRSRTSPRTGEIVRDDVLDHAHDTLRYAAAYVWGHIARNEQPRGVDDATKERK